MRHAPGQFLDKQRHAVGALSDLVRNLSPQQKKERTLESGLLREETDRYVLDRALPPFAIPTTLHAGAAAGQP
jgi:hypothetical protein